MTRDWRRLCAAAAWLLAIAFIIAHAALLAPSAAAQGVGPLAVEAPPALPAEGEFPHDENADEGVFSIPYARTLFGVLVSGGPLMIPIGLCSVVLVVFVLERLLSLRQGAVIPGPFVERFIAQLKDGELDRDEALELCEQNKSPVADVFAAAVKKWGRAAVEIEQAIIDEGERVTNGLRAYIRWFNGIAQISPLLGMLGTVFGMIESFHAIASAGAMGRAHLLAGGISEALISTAAGLIVAIPALAAYLYFTGRVDALVTEIDALSQQVVEAIASDVEPRGSNRKSERSEKRKAA